MGIPMDVLKPGDTVLLVYTKRGGALWLYVLDQIDQRLESDPRLDYKSYQDGWDGVRAVSDPTAITFRAVVRETPKVTGRVVQEAGLTVLLISGVILAGLAFMYLSFRDYKIIAKTVQEIATNPELSESTKAAALGAISQAGPSLPALAGSTAGLIAVILAGLWLWGRK